MKNQRFARVSTSAEKCWFISEIKNSIIYIVLSLKKKVKNRRCEMEIRKREREKRRVKKSQNRTRTRDSLERRPGHVEHVTLIPPRV